MGVQNAKEKTPKLHAASFVEAYTQYMHGRLSKEMMHNFWFLTFSPCHHSPNSVGAF